MNGRAVENVVLSTGLREGYHTALMKGQHPVTFLFVDLDPGGVDVNVHPAKREVRFRDPKAVREALVKRLGTRSRAIASDWQAQFNPAPSRTIDQPTVPTRPSAMPGGTSLVSSASSVQPSPTPAELPQLETEFSLRGERAVEILTRAPFQPNEPASVSRASHRQDFQIIGVLNKLYVLMESAAGLVLVDQHAAHERILFEELRRRMEEQGVPSQRLLLPQTFDLPPRDAEWVERNLATLQKMGIGIEGFGPNTFKIDSLPAFVSAPDAVAFMQGVIDELKSASNSASPLRLGEDMIAKTVCRHAVKANDPLRHPELEKLIQDLLACDLPYCCPHGRPTMIQISHAELEKKFGRESLTRSSFWGAVRPSLFCVPSGVVEIERVTSWE